MTTRLRAVALAVCVLMALPCCGPSSERLAAPRPTQPAQPVTPTRSITVRERVWTFESRAHRVIETPSYQLFTTEPPESILSQRMPLLLELALDHYTTALGPLPRPQEPLETYLVSNRPQWTRLTQRLMGENAAPFLAIQRGGFAANGRGVYWDIGPQDTFAMAAHEGWHQFTQRTFRESLPVWLEEGIACYMEGFRWDQARADLPIFMPWANLERFDQLRRAMDSPANSAQALMPLDRLTSETPQNLVQLAGDPALTWYAQVWSLVHFLESADSGAYRPALRRMVADAQAGRLVSTVRASAGDRAAGALLTRRTGGEVIEAYTGKSLAELEDRYRAFLQAATQPGARDKVTAGLSPI